MIEKYKKQLQECASALDKLAGYNGAITRKVLTLMLTRDVECTRDLCNVLSEIATRYKHSSQILEIARATKDSLIDYYGYLTLSEIYEKRPDESVSHQDERSLPELLTELNQLVGLQAVKSKVKDLINYQKVQQLRRNSGLFSGKNTLHLAFTGNPGTGKTTVARIIGRIYKQLGLLSKGHFIEVSRTDLIAGYQGQTALKVKEVIEKAKGGVLFIDEAYSITENEHCDSYGRECLTELTKALEDFREDLVVIVAGYTEPMKTFFESNPGLKSRFNTFIEFEDYKPSELQRILQLICKTNDYSLHPDALSLLEVHLTTILQNSRKPFANGRFVRNLFDDMVMNHARRVVALTHLTLEDLQEIKKEDLNGILPAYPL